MRLESASASHTPRLSLRHAIDGLHGEQQPPTIESFDEQLSAYIISPIADPQADPAVTTPSFVRSKGLKAWLEKKPTQEGITNLEYLLEDAYRTRLRRPAVESVDYERVLKTCPLTFCLLLEQKRGYLIEDFLRHNIVDAHLDKIHVNDLEERLSKILGADSRAFNEVLQGFDKKRWAYRPHIFRFEDDSELPKSIVLPIYKRQQISQKGGTASIHQLCIPSEFLDEPMKYHLSKSAYFEPSLGKCYQIVAKTFHEGDRDLYEGEIRAYKHLKKQPGMVRFLGAYTHRNAENRAEHNILLEYGEYDLAEYFRIQPPILPTNVFNFWHNMGNVASALSELHSFTLQSRGQQEEYQGWHADLKPDNILSVQGTLKLADPGFAGFARIGDPSSKRSSMITGMTSTYGPPECHSYPQTTRLPQLADIWSLGCVFSEAATWQILGPPGLRAYRTLRERAVERIVDLCKRQDFRDSGLSSVHNIGKGDYFHDGNDVLHEIKQWHEYLRTVKRPSHKIVGRMLDLVDQHMLRQNPAERISAKDLRKAIRDIEKDHPAQHPEKLTHAIEEAVSAVEKELQEQPAAGLLGQQLTIQDRKLLKTKTVFQLQTDEVVRISDMMQKLQLASTGGRHKSGGVGEPTSPDQSRAERFHVDTSPKNLPQGTVLTQWRSPPNLRQNISRRHDPQTIFDAHYKTVYSDEKMKEKKSLLKRMKKGKHAGQPKTKDELLEMHYNNRDIKFIVDNAGSMGQEWYKVMFVLEKLAQKAAWIDDDGMDLEAVNGSAKTKINEKTFRQDIRAFMEAENVIPRNKIGTNMSQKLGKLLFEWLEEFKRLRGKMKGVTFIILTDGKWISDQDRHDVDSKITEFDTQFKRIAGNSLLTRFVSIQFISFGDDPDGLYRLRHLDNDLKYDRGIDDIVDTEHYDGDVYKMLLGSLVPEFDQLDVEPEREEWGAVVSDRQETSAISSQFYHFPRRSTQEHKPVDHARREEPWSPSVPRTGQFTPTYRTRTPTSNAETPTSTSPLTNPRSGIGIQFSKREDPAASHYHDWR